MSDGAILAHDVLVLEHDTCPRAVVLRNIWSAHEVDDLVRLNRAGARIHRVRTDTGQIVDLKGGDRPVSLHADPPPAAMVAGMNVGVETFEPISHEFYRPAQQF